MCGNLTSQSCKVVQSDNLVCFELSTATPVRDDHAAFAQTFVDKVMSGMGKLQSWTAETQKKYLIPADLGISLMEHRREAKANGTSNLEEFLDRIARNTNDIAWLATIYARYLSYQRRCTSPNHSETRDLGEEHRVRNKELICILTNRVMNELQPQWGVYSTLLFSALKGTGTVILSQQMLTKDATETKFKGSYLYKGVGKNKVNEIADLIVQLLLRTDITLEISRDVPVINPAFFLGIFLDRS